MIFENDNPYNKPTEHRRSRITNPTPYSGLGKLAPQATDLEEAILGSIMLERIDNIMVWSMFRPEIFYKDNHQKIANAILSLKAIKTPIDIMTVTAKLRSLGELETIGGAYYITELTNRVASAANIEFHLRIIYQKFIQRELIRVGTNIIQNGYEDTSDPFDIMTNTVNEINHLEKGIFKNTEKNASVLVDEIIADMNQPKFDGIIGNPTAFKGIDFVLQGNQKGDFNIEAGRPGMGKSAKLISSVVDSGFNKKRACGIFSLEMKGIQLTYRAISNISSIPTKLIKQNSLSDIEQERFNDYSSDYRKAPIYIDDTPGLYLDEFKNKVAMWVALYGIEELYIDYIQRMKGYMNKRYSTRDEELADVSRTIKETALDNNITIHGVATLSRKTEDRPGSGNIPVMSDLRECGALEYDADSICMLWRPEYYENLKMDPINVKLFNITISEMEGLLFAIIVKSRNEATGKVPLKFDGKLMRVYDHPLVLDSIKPINTNQFTTESRPAPF